MQQSLVALSLALILGLPTLAQAPARDPFVAPSSTAPQPQSTCVLLPERPQPTPAPRPVTVTPPARPELILTGVVAGQALVSFGERTRIVKVGDRLGDLRVVSIEARTLTLVGSGARYSFRLPSEVGLQQ